MNTFNVTGSDLFFSREILMYESEFGSYITSEEVMFCHFKDTDHKLNTFQSKAHLLLANRKSDTYNLTLE